MKQLTERDKIMKSIKTTIKELLDQATILSGKKTNDEIAEYLVESGVTVNSKHVNDDKLLKFLIKCQRNHYKPDLHTFYIDVLGGRAYVECREHEVYIEAFDGSHAIRWCGTAVAAANKLEMMGAAYETIDM